MKKFYILFLLSALTAAATAQSGKQVQWAYTANKIADKIYEVHMTATIGGSYHMYSQNAGVDGPLPTTFKFTTNPLAATDGKVKEVGKLVKKLKGNIKTNLAGTVEFIVCNESQCLPPSTVDIKVNIGG